jgi:hypothetical protein
MAFALVLRFNIAHCGAQERRKLVQEPCCSKALILYRLAKIVLKYTTLPISRSANHNIPKADIMLRLGALPQCRPLSRS